MSKLPLHRRGPGAGKSSGGRAWLFVLPWSIASIGGVNEVVRQLYRRAGAGGIRPMLLETAWNAAPGDDGDYALLRMPLTDPWPRHGRLRAVLAFAIRGPAAVYKLARLVQSENVAAINPHFPGLECVHFALLKGLGLFRGRLVFTLHGADIAAARQSRGVERLIWKAVLRSADRVIACSRALAGVVAAFDPKLSSRLAVVNNGVDPVEFLKAGGEPFEMPARTAGKRVLLSVGKFEHKKGHDVLIRAFQQLLGIRDDLRLVLVGARGPALEEIRGMIAGEGLGDYVSLYTDVPHHRINSIFQRASLFVLASRVEPLGIVVLEAAAAKVPVVASAVGGIPEIVTDGVSGLLVPPDNPSALAAAIGRLADNPDRAAALAARLHEDVLARFNWDEKFRQYMHFANL